MSNKSHYNKGHIALNRMKRDNVKHSSHIEFEKPEITKHFVALEDSVKFLTKIPDNSIDFILIDPPYNLELETWDTYSNYLEWAKGWLVQIPRILTKQGNVVIFGGFQFQSLKNGDLLELLHYFRHKTNMKLINIIIWYYKNGMSAHRFFANRHEEAIWLSKTKKYYFDLDSVRIPFDKKTEAMYLRDKRLNPDNVRKGKNPTNVWEIGRLNGNSKERVGHPTQKPKEVIRRLIKGLSFPGATVLDFFAGSGTTGAVCIEEGRHSIQVDIEPNWISKYFNKHIENSKNIFNQPYEICDNSDVKVFLESLS